MPYLTSTQSAHTPQDAKHLDRLNRFASGHRLREMRFTGRNVNRFLRAGLGPEAARRFLDPHRRHGCEAEQGLASDLYLGPFDHGECWGRDGRPLVLIGHPYDLRESRSALLRRLASLGLDLLISRTAGWYGFGTLHVRLSVPGTLPTLTDAQRFETELALDA